MVAEIYFAAGCFWGAQRYFDLLRGVVGTTVGYANGRTANPTYEQVKHEGTGHAETVRVRYDPETITLGELLSLYFRIIDPTSLNRQGGDVGEQYRTGVYFTDPADRSVIMSALSELQKGFSERVRVECQPLENFYTAEEYHQKYLEKNPGGYCHVLPDMTEFAKNYIPSGAKKGD